MKILVVNNFYFPHQVGGAEESLQLQCEALMGLGQEVHVLTIAHDEQPRIANVNGVTVHYLATAFSGGSPLQKNRTLLRRLGWQFGTSAQVIAQTRIFRLLKDGKFNILYANNLPGIGRAVVLMARMLGIPVVAGLRDYAWICLRQSRFEGGKNCESTCMKCRIGCIGRRALSKTVRGVAANSKTLLEPFERDSAFTSARKKVIYAGAPSTGRTTHLCGAKHNELTSARVGVMGQIQPSKGFDIFLDETKDIALSGQISIVVSGSISSDYAVNLRNRHDPDRVNFTGHINRSDFFSLVDIVVIPSIWNEPLSRVTYEALSHGKVVIASTHGGQKEVIKDGHNGFIYTPGDGSLKIILMRLINEPRTIAEIESNAIKSAQHYTPQRAAADLLDLFETVENSK